MYGYQACVSVTVIGPRLHISRYVIDTMFGESLRGYPFIMIKIAFSRHGPRQPFICSNADLRRVVAMCCAPMYVRAHGFSLALS